MPQQFNKTGCAERRDGCCDLPDDAKPETKGCLPMAVSFTKVDLEYLLTQIQMAETNTPPVSPHLAFGLREVAGTNNNQVPGQGSFGSTDQTFPSVTQQYYQTVNVDGTFLDANPGTAGDMVSYVTTTPGAIMGVIVIDGSPRTISPFPPTPPA
jgi:hypothetical protein